MILALLSYIGILVGFFTLVFTIASGLYYLSEQVEEHTVLAKRVLVRLIFGILAVHVLLLLFDGFPLWPTAVSIAVNVLYLKTLRQFPSVQMNNPFFVAACIGALFSHYLWFRYFGSDERPPHSIYENYPHYEGDTHPPFRQIASFFGICIWLVPFALFVSLSANDFVLPTSTEPVAGQHTQHKRKGLAKDLVEKMWHYLALASRKCGIEMASPYDVLA